MNPTQNRRNMQEEPVFWPNGQEPGVQHLSEKVSTTSMVKMLWLTKFRGYRLWVQSVTPKVDMFGNIYYQRHWQLYRSENSPVKAD